MKTIFKILVWLCIVMATTAFCLFMLGNSI